MFGIYENYRCENDDPQTEKFRKLFIGGITSNTTENILEQYFEQWGEVVYCTVKRNRDTMSSRGFGFLIYRTAEMLDDAQRNRPHIIDNKKVDTRRATPRNEMHLPVNKLYVGGLKYDTTEDDLQEVFGVFGRIKKLDVIMDKNTGKQKGFCFITFEDVDSVDKCVLLQRIPLRGQYVQVKRALDGGRETSGSVSRKSSNNIYGYQRNQDSPIKPDYTYNSSKDSPIERYYTSQNSPDSLIKQDYINHNRYGYSINQDNTKHIGYGYPGNQVYPVNSPLDVYPGYYSANLAAYGFGPGCIGVPYGGYGYDFYDGYNFGYGYSGLNFGAQFIQRQ